VSSKTKTAINAVLATSPVPASVIYKHLESLRIGRSAAKSAVSRMLNAGEIQQYTLTLGNGNSVLSLGTPAQNPSLFRSLYDNNFFGRPAIKSLVDCLRTSHQIISRVDVAKIAALQVGSAASPDFSDSLALMKGLTELGIVVPHASMSSTWEVGRNTLRAAGLSFGLMNLSPAHLALREKIRFTLIKALAGWLRNNSFVSEGGTQVSSPLSEVVSFGGVPFDVLGFSYARGLADRRRESFSPAALVGDCLVEECNLPYAESFVRRVKQAESKTSRAFVPFVLAKVFQPDAFRFLREEGVLSWTQSQLFGKQTADAVQHLLDIAENIIAQKQLNPRLFVEMFEGFENFQSLFGDLKGKMFELLMAYFFQKRCKEVKLGWLVRRDWMEPESDLAPAPRLDTLLEEGDGCDEESRQDFPEEAGSDQYDVDIVGFRAAEADIVECKGIGSDKAVEDGEVRKHFTGRVPLVRSLLSQEQSRKLKRFRAILVTTGGFEEDTLQKMRNGEYRARPDTTYDLWDRERLLREFELMEETELIQIVDRFYK